MLAACSNEDENAGTDIIQLRSNINENVEMTTRAKTESNLQNTQFVSGKTIMVEAYEKDATTAYTSGNYTTGTSGSMTGTLYYPASQKNIDICAYYPSAVTSSSTTFGPISTAQTTDANYQSSDLMYATKLTDKAKGSTHELTFNHAMAKIVVNLTAGNGVTESNITSNVSAVKINNTITSATISKGQVTGTSGSTKADIDITDSKTSNCGIIVPQKLTAGTTFITVTYNSTNLTYAIPTGDKTFEAGKVYTYTFTVSATAISLKSLSITNWTAGTGDSKTLIL